MLIRCIDFEGTGVPSEEDPQALCEVGWCDLVSVDGATWFFDDPIAMLVQPNRAMPPEAAAVHGIIDADLVAAPPVTTAFRHLMAGPPDYFAAFNADYEQAFFRGGDVPWIDPYKAAVRLWPDAPNHQQGTLRYVLGLPLDRSLAFPPHRAGPDAYVLAGLLAHILNEGLCDMQMMSKWSKGPPLLPRINFGKHKGLKWSDAPADYLDWVLNKSDMDKNIKANAKHWLKQRNSRQARLPAN